MLYRTIKRILDFVFAFVALILLSPLMLLTMLIIRIESPGEGTIIKQERLGQDLAHFRVYKFRTMVSSNVDFKMSHALVNDNDQRLLRCGKILRKLKIDELPQLINILRGEMSFIGPRPLLPVYSNVYERWELDKFRIKPGLSGLSQVNGNSYLPTYIRSYYDVLYVDKMSVFLDIGILFKTFLIVFMGESKFAKHPDEAALHSLIERHTPPSADEVPDAC